MTHNKLCRNLVYSFLATKGTIFIVIRLIDNADFCPDFAVNSHWIQGVGRGMVEEHGVLWCALHLETYRNICMSDKQLHA